MNHDPVRPKGLPRPLSKTMYVVDPLTNPRLRISGMLHGENE